MDTSTQTVLMELLEPEMFVGVSDRYSDTSNNRTLIRGEIICTNSQLYYGKEG